MGRLLAALALSAVLLLAFFYAVHRWFDAFIQRRVQEEAHARGMLLRFEQARLSIDDWRAREGTLTLTGNELSWPGVPSLSAHLETLSIALVLQSLDRVQVREVRGSQGQVAWFGSLDELQHQLQRDGDLPPLGFPASLEQLTVKAGSSGDVSPLLALDAAALQIPTSEGATLSAPRGQLGNWQLRDVLVRTTRDRASLHVEAAGEGDALASIDLTLDKTQRFAELGVDAKIRQAALLLQLPSEYRDQVPKRLDLALGVRRTATGYTGKLNLSAEGWEPPHPVELSGFDFGSATRFSTRFDTDLLWQGIQLGKTSLEAGAFRLDGSGHVERQALLADMHLDLQGALSCEQVAASMATAQAGSVFARFFREAAHQFLRGSVQVRVVLDAGFPSLTPPRLRRGIGVGCGLRPLREVELLPLIDSLPTLKAALPALSEKLDQLDLPRPRSPWPNLAGSSPFEWRFPWQKQ